ncbi:MAG: putative oxidoreductase [Rhizobium sp.]|nr:putative oxidoreductase [Rhizobium sp.]
MLRWGILGTSFISEIMADAIASSENSSLEAVMGRDHGRLEAFASRHGIAKRYGDIGTLLDDDTIDIVYVGLPNNVHHSAVIAAAKRGKAIISEKSLTVTMNDAHALADAVRTSGVFFMEGLMYLNHPVVAELGAIVRSGRLGQLRSINGLYAADISKFVNPAGGGTLFNLGCYPASLLHYVMQAACGDDAFGQRRIAGHGNMSATDGNIGDAAVSALFSNGVLATLQSTDSYGMAWNFTIYGETGVARFKTNPWLPIAGDNIIEVEIYGQAPDQIVVSTGLDAFQHQVLTTEAALRDGLTQARRPSPRLTDSLDIMGFLTDWEASCRAGG